LDLFGPKALDKRCEISRWSDFAVQKGPRGNRLGWPAQADSL
jgi:hypothetical protein